MPHVLIPGASPGPGRALARGFSAAGWTVSACATDPDAIQSLAKELGPQQLALICDVTQCVEGEEFATRVLVRFGPTSCSATRRSSVRNALLWEVLPE